MGIIHRHKTMEQDNQLKHHLWWLKRFLNEGLEKDYAKVMRQELNDDIIKELDMLVAHIKLNY